MYKPDTSCPADGGIYCVAPEAERLLLGAMIALGHQGDTADLSQITSTVSATDFAQPDYGKLFLAIADAAKQHEQFDMAVVHRAAAARGICGDRLHEIVQDIGQVARFCGGEIVWPCHARDVREAALRRRLTEDVRRLNREIEGGDLQAAAEQLTGMSARLAQPASSDRPKLALVPASELHGAESVPWLWDGWAVPGYTTLLVGLWKAGKSTLLSHVLAATRHGGDVAGRVEPCSVVVVTEEGAGLWASRRDDLRIDDNVRFLIRPFRARPGQGKWESVIRELAAEAKVERANLVIFDTISAAWPVRDENDAPAVLAALQPLHHLTEAGAAVVLVHHPRKGDAQEGQAARGSGALPGFVDVIVELRRYDPGRSADCRRKLTGLSRFEQTPAELVVELKNGAYETIGTTGQASQIDRQTVIKGILEASDKPLTAEAIKENWPQEGSICPGLTRLRATLTTGFETGEWNRCGSGKKCDPLRFYDANAIPSPLGSMPTESNPDEPTLLPDDE